MRDGGAYSCAVPRTTSTLIWAREDRSAICRVMGNSTVAPFCTVSQWPIDSIFCYHLAFNFVSNYLGFLHALKLKFLNI